jgi:hypothetical protein
VVAGACARAMGSAASAAIETATIHLLPEFIVIPSTMLRTRVYARG